MHSVTVFFVFITIASTWSEWIKFRSTCYLVNGYSADMAKAQKVCKSDNALLTKISDQEEFNFIRKNLEKDKEYWVWANRQGDRYLCAVGRNCHDSWWAPGEPVPTGTCALLKYVGTAFLLLSKTCGLLHGFICSKPATTHTLVKREDYNVDELCGVEIMPNCEDLSCGELCESHQDCDQYAKMLNVCVKIKNASIENCVINLRQNLELYNFKRNC